MVEIALYNVFYLIVLNVFMSKGISLVQDTYGLMGICRLCVKEGALVQGVGWV